MACVNGRTDPELWEKSKKKAIEQLGGRFSARAMQLAGKLYRDAGGGYCGKKTKAQKSMSKWSGEDWTTADDKPARRKVDGKVVYDRYLPRAAWKKLSKAQKAATRKKKRASDDQFVANTAKAAKAGKSARGESMSYLERYRELTQKSVPKKESRKPNEAIQRLSESRATDMARLKKLAGISEVASGASPTAAVIKALDGKRTVGGNLLHEPDPTVDDYVAFATLEGETLDGDDYDYPGLVASFNKYAKKLKQEVQTLLAKAKVTGWTDVAVTNGSVVVYKA